MGPTTTTMCAMANGVAPVLCDCAGAPAGYADGKRKARLNLSSAVRPCPFRLVVGPDTFPLVSESAVGRQSDLNLTSLEPLVYGPEVDAVSCGSAEYSLCTGISRRANRSFRWL